MRKPDPQKAIGRIQPWALLCGALQHPDLVTEGNVLELQSGSGFCDDTAVNSIRSHPKVESSDLWMKYNSHDLNRFSIYDRDNWEQADLGSWLTTTVLRPSGVGRTEKVRSACSPRASAT